MPAVPTQDRDGPGPLDDRYVSLKVSDAGAVVYDRENPHAWVQSDLTLPVGGVL